MLGSGDDRRAEPAGVEAQQPVPHGRVRRLASAAGNGTLAGVVPTKRLTALLAALFLLGAGCSTPVGVRRVDERSVHRTHTTNVLSAGEPSVPSRQVLLRLGLFERFRSDPVSTLAELHGRTLEKMNADGLFALAEYSFLHARRTRGRAYFVAASIYAYAFLFPEDGSPSPTSVDPRLRTAVDLYNRSVALALVSEDGEVALRGGVFRFHLGTLDLDIDPAGFRWADRRLTNFVSAAELEVRGLRNRYRQVGIGAPFAAEAVETEGQSIGPESRRVVGGKIPVTFFIRYADARTGLRSGELHASVELYSQDTTVEIEVAGARVPLEYETTSALALSLEGSRLWSFGITGFRRGDALPVEDGLMMMTPYVPGRIPVVFVHGTASSPARWAELVNELQSDSRLLAHYQLWLFIYTTGNPILYSARRLRQSLDYAVEELDPEGHDAALRRMVVIGHSQGGLLAKLQVISSGDRFWHNVSELPFEKFPMKPETREFVGEAVFFERRPYIERVIFIATPHRGSFVAGNWLGRFASNLFTAPQNLVGMGVELARSGIDLAGSGLETLRGDEDAALVRRMGRIPSSVENMRPDHPFSLTLASIPVDPGVIAHSIIPVRGGPPPAGQDDGVVTFESAHIEEAKSELVVFHDGHSTQSSPQTIEEVRRILREHLAESEVARRAGG